MSEVGDVEDNEDGSRTVTISLKMHKEDKEEAMEVLRFATRESLRIRTQTEFGLMAADIYNIAYSAGRKRATRTSPFIHFMHGMTIGAPIGALVFLIARHFGS